jgi:transcriptional regulator with XRE-family HTH domain
VTIRDLEELGRLLRSHRNALGLTLEEASGRMRVSPRLLLELEHGRRGVRIDTVIRLIQTLGLDLVVRTRARRPLTTERSPQ